MSTTEAKAVEAARVLAPGHTYRSVTEKISALVLTRPVGRGWLAGAAYRGGSAVHGASQHPPWRPGPRT